jgi:hypothetical protein
MTTTQSTGTATSARSLPRIGGWRVRIPASLDISEISPRHFKMLVILEGFCGDKSYCWPGNRTLAVRYGCKIRQVQDILSEMEAAGILWRRPVDPDRPGSDRAGIFLHKRLDPDRPVEDRPPPPEAVRRLWEARRWTDGTPLPHADFCAPPHADFRAPSNKESLSLNKPYLERADADLAQRQRPEPPDSPAVLVIPAPATTAAVPASMSAAAGGTALVEPEPAAAPIALVEPIAPVEPEPAAAPMPEPAAEVLGDQAAALTAGQREFLDSLADEQRAALLAMTPAKRSTLLEPHRAGFDPAVRGFQVRSELRCRPAAPLPIFPPTTAEVLKQLPGAPHDWTQKAAECLARDFGEKKDRQLWGEFWKIAEAVRLSRLAAADVLNAYDQAMRPGIKNRGAKFWKALRCLTGIDPESLRDLAGQGGSRHDSG